MDDFKAFLDRVLAPIRDQARDSAEKDGLAERAPTVPVPDNQLPVLPRAVSHEELELRYMEVMNALLSDAMDRKAVTVFSEVVTWKLAVVAYGWGPRATGDVMRRLGTHLANLAQLGEAQREADEAKKGGQRPN